MTRHLLSTTLALSACLCTARTHGQAFAGGGATASAAAEASAATNFRDGTKALDAQHWQDAVTAFDKVIAAKDSRADAALYWKAYALNKLHRDTLASATCGKLASTYPQSTWNRDCTALRSMQADSHIIMQTDAADPGMIIHADPNLEPMSVYVSPTAALDGQRMRLLQNQLHAQALHSLAMPADAAGSEADLKMLALNSLMLRDPAKALPAVKNVLTSNTSTPRLKQRAITALGMSSSPDARALLRDLATGKVPSTEQRFAVSMLGTFQGKSASDTLAEIYRSSSDRSVKRDALNGLFIAGDAPRLVELARAETDLPMKRDIVAKLALMHDKAATDYMLDLLK